MGIVKIDATSEIMQVQFMPNPPIESLRIIQLIQSQRNIKLAGQDRLRVTVSAPKIADRVMEVRKLMKSLM
jgi:transcription-repair coupling factor (superfamily II helicase)